MVRAHKSASDGRYGWNGRYGTDFSLGNRTYVGIGTHGTHRPALFLVAIFSPDFENSMPTVPTYV
ncbi:unnamed protein product [Callosobruchus maculatus]|uniref:Uncharacterized protein n=1 Tax=Callosobruchus maculatus TaxID=64391 RepID=A0A653D6F0_CALMS|nr:unnamed protein product [Callosobruchus maculatus]